MRQTGWSSMTNPYRHTTSTGTQTHRRSSPTARYAAVLIAVFTLLGHKAEIAHAGFSDAEVQALKTMYEAQVEYLSEPGTTNTSWARIMKGKPLWRSGFATTGTDITTLRNSGKDTLEYVRQLVATKSGNCGEHATILHAGLMFIKTHMVEGKVTQLFGDVSQHGFSPGDHAFVVVTSADGRAVAVVDTCARVFRRYSMETYKYHIQGNTFASILWGHRASTPSNPYLKRNSRIVRAPDLDIWPQLSVQKNLKHTFPDAFPALNQVVFGN